MSEKNIGAQFLHERDPALHQNSAVTKGVSYRRRHGEPIAHKPAKEIVAWLDLVDSIYKKHRDDPKVLHRLRIYYHKTAILLKNTADIPQTFWNTKAEVQIRAGKGGDLGEDGVEKVTRTDHEGRQHIDYIFPEDMQEEELEITIRNQQNSLDQWLDYLTSDDAPYPNWAKYWAFTSVQRMGKFVREENDEGETHAYFQKRTSTTMNPFPLLNQRALATTISRMEAILIKKRKLQQTRSKLQQAQYGTPEYHTLRKEREQLMHDLADTHATEEFSTMYTTALLEIPEYSTEGLEETRGTWVTYSEGSEPDALVESLIGHPLEWCTADSETARDQLEDGDFHVYYSRDQNGNPTIPRLAIRMEDGQIAEHPRGIAPGQNLDPFITPILNNKLEKLGQVGDRYKEKAAILEQFNIIWDKHILGQELTIDDLCILYPKKPGQKIEGFGYAPDPRIQELLDTRDTRADLVQVFGIPPNLISLSVQELFEKEAIELHYGDISLQDNDPVPDTFPKKVVGDLTFTYIPEGTRLPEILDGDLLIFQEGRIQSITCPDRVFGRVELFASDADTVVFPRVVTKDFEAMALKRTSGCVFPEQAEEISLPSLTNASGITFPRKLTTLALGNAITLQGASLPEIITEDLFLQNITDFAGITLPIVEGTLYVAENAQLSEAQLAQIRGKVVYGDENNDADYFDA